jgi:hypothetical protein
MPIDPNIALGVKPMQVKSQGEYLNELYNQQNAEQTNQLNMMKMQAMNREIADSEAVKNYFATTNRDDPNFAQGLSAISPKLGMDYDEYTAKIATQKAAAAEHAEGTTGKKLTNVKEASAFHRDNLWGVTDALSAAAWVENLYKDATIGSNLESMISKQQMLASIPTDPAQLANWKTQVAMGSKEFAKDRMAKPSNLAILQNEYAALSPNDPNRAAYEAAIKKESEFAPFKPEPSTDIPKLKPGEVWDATKQTVKQVPGSAEYNKQSKIHGTDYNAAKTVVSKMDNAIKKVNEILKPENASGFENNFGGYNAAVSRMFSGNTATVRKDIDTLKADMKGAGLELIRAGGSIGALTEREWPMLEAQIDAIDYMLDEPAAKKAFERVKTTFERIKDQAKDTYQTTWGETQYYKPDVLKGGSPPPPPADAVKLTPEQKKKYDALKAKHG